MIKREREREIEGETRKGEKGDVKISNVKEVNRKIHDCARMSPSVDCYTPCQVCRQFY